MKAKSTTIWLASLAAVALFPSLSYAGDPTSGESEMQDRSSRHLLNRGTQSIEWALHSDKLGPAQVAAGQLLLDELRRNMALFLDFSGLDDAAMQAKLGDFLEVARYQVTTDLPKSAGEPTESAQPK